jgi:hypothetical protein
LIGRAAKAMGISPDDYTLQFRVYGKDAVLGAYETAPVGGAHELCLICDVVGRTEEISGAIGTRLGPTGSRLDILGKMGGGGNFAYPFSPSLIKVGPVYEWGAWHIVDTDEAEMEALFPVTVEDIG